MLAFAGNSILCRLALKETDIDPSSFTTFRLLSGAVMLYLLAHGKVALSKPKLLPALSLFIYAAAFAYAYRDLSAATGALLLFGAVQFTMLALARYQGETFSFAQLVGIAIAFFGVMLLLLPGASAPSWLETGLMLLAGIAWGCYSMLGKGSATPLQTSAQSFILAVPLSLLLTAVTFQYHDWDSLGVCYAIASGAITSGLGYAIWYRVLPLLKATTAASVQLSVPAITAIASAVIIAEAISVNLVLSTLAILGGIALVINAKQPKP